MKIGSNTILDMISFHKFIETPDNFYINSSAYDKNFSKIQGDELGITINKDSIKNHRADGSYPCYQNINMIANETVQLVRDELSIPCGCKNGILIDNIDNNIFYIIAGADKSPGLTIVDKSNNTINTLAISNEYNGSYHKKSGGKIEILTQTKDYVYILTTDNAYMKEASSYSARTVNRITKVKKANSIFNYRADLSHGVTNCQSSNTAYESLYKTSDVTVCNSDSSMKLYDDNNYCIVITTTKYGECILNLIDKPNDSVSKRILLAQTKESIAIKPVFEMDSFMDNHYACTYVLASNVVSNSGFSLYLLKINTNDPLNDFFMDECDIDLSLISKIILDTSSSILSTTTFPMFINEVAGTKYMTLIQNVETNIPRDTYPVDMITYEISKNLKSFTIVHSENRMLNSEFYKHTIRIKDNLFIAFSNSEAAFMTFNKIEKRYIKAYSYANSKIAFASKTSDGRVIIQDHFNQLHELTLKQNITVKSWFEKNRYSSKDINKISKVYVSISNDFGDYLGDIKVNVTIVGETTFDDGTITKDIVTSNNESTSLPILIKSVGNIRTKIKIRQKGNQNENI